MSRLLTCAAGLVRRISLQARRQASGLAFWMLVAPALLLARPKPAVQTFRWTANAPGCTFTRSDDGKYVYGLSTPDADFTIAVDSQELAKVHRRIEPFFSLLVSVRYRGSSKLDLGPEGASLEFVTHQHVVQHSLDPDSFGLRTQEDVEQAEFEIEREIKKHPERKDEREHFLQAYKKEVTDFQDFLSRRTLSDVELNPADAQATGWVLFSTHSKWLGAWKSREAFVFRMVWKTQVVEFPFALPPEPGDLILRHRE